MTPSTPKQTSLWARLVSFELQIKQDFPQLWLLTYQQWLHPPSVGLIIL